MKVNPEASTVINIVKQSSPQPRKAESSDQKQRIADTITLENKQASTSRVQNVEEAKNMLNQVVNDIQSSVSNLHSMNLERVINLIQ